MFMNSIFIVGNCWCDNFSLLDPKSTAAGKLQKDNYCTLFICSCIPLTSAVLSAKLQSSFSDLTPLIYIYKSVTKDVQFVFIKQLCC